MSRYDAAVWQCASVLLDYPDERTRAALDAVGRAAPAVPGPAGDSLQRLVGHLVEEPLEELQERYVETFDTRRKHSLFLTYFAHGDTRKRGLALLRFKQVYLAAGQHLVDDELPDHLCVVLEFAATVDPDAGRQLLLDHRAGLEVLRLALREADSPWADALEAVCSTLPALRGDERAAVQRLAAEGPPAEEVGLSPYGPAFDARLAERQAGTTDLPMPAMRGASR